MNALYSRCDSFPVVKAIFFAPFSNVWDHSFPEAMIAESLAKEGIEIVTVKCDGLFDSFCIAMSASGLNDFALPAQKKQVCNACKKRRNLLDKHFPFTSLLIDNYLDAVDYAEVEKLTESATTSNWSELLFRGRPLGKYAAYEFLLNFKILGTIIPENLFPKYLDHLRNTILCSIAAEKIINEQKPDVVLTYNRLYGINHAFLDVAEQRNIPTYSLQGGGHITHRAETMTIFKNSETQFQLLDSPEWEEFRSNPISKNQVDLVSSHLYGLMEGSSAFAYSSASGATNPEEIRGLLSIPLDKPTLLVPLSSEDEINAALLADLIPDTSDRVDLFADQLDWLKFVIEYARENDSYHFVIRLHPRMFPNKRESVLAPMLTRVKSIIENVPKNVTINTPDDEVSIYDLLQITDLVLGYRSSVGAEFAAFGVPVVSPANQYFYTYPTELHIVANTLDDYKKAIADGLEKGWSFEQARLTFRWFAFLFSRICVDLSDAVRSKPSSLRPQKPGLSLLLWKKMVFLIIQFGPLIRERLAIKNRSLNPSAALVINDVILNSRSSTAVSTKWENTLNSYECETEQINSFFEGLLKGPWKSINDIHSLAETIRKYLARN